MDLIRCPGSGSKLTGKGFTGEGRMKAGSKDNSNIQFFP